MQAFINKLHLVRYNMHMQRAMVSARVACVRAGLAPCVC